jgi:uncharacterized integral membrane protein
MERFKLVSIGVLIVMGIIIILQNTQPVETRILFMTITMPRAILLMVTTLIGFALGVLVSFLFQRKDKKEQNKV